MNKYLTIINMSIKDEKIFKVNYYLSFASVPIQIFISYFFWKYALNSNDVNGFTLINIILYFIFMKLLQIAYQPAMYTTYDLWNDINTGTIIVWLFKPISYPLYIFSKKLYRFFVSLIPSLIITFVAFYLVNLNVNVHNFLIGGISSILGFIILYEIQFLIGCLTFWLKNVITLRDTIMDILKLIGGLIIPLDFMPRTIQRISLYTPMSNIYYFPVKILIGNTNSINLMILSQVIWITLFAVAIKIIWKKGSYNIEQGS
ncbi:ABC-2 family transporter protein [Tyzzerella sp. OttesenSCG-928-J15]|nr:ABC-2 family transporter protein [Tyzzerella sp. OttesenSCG-928-J15]